VKFKFVKKSADKTIWEAGADRSFDVPSTPTSFHHAEGWRGQ
jgi:hypothetical protein